MWVYFWILYSGRTRGYLFIYLFLAVLSLHCCTWAFSSCNEWGLLFIVLHGLLIMVASLVGEHRLSSIQVSVDVVRGL